MSGRIASRLQHLDNEASGILKEFLATEDINYQLVPPYVHRCNTAECAICTFKNHFIARLSSTDKDFPSTCGITCSPKQN